MISERVEITCALKTVQNDNKHWIVANQTVIQIPNYGESSGMTENKKLSTRCAGALKSTIMRVKMIRGNDEWD